MGGQLMDQQMDQRGKKKSGRHLTPLKPGDQVAIVAPGFRSTVQDLQAAIRFVEKQKWIPVISPKIFNKNFLFSNEDDFRAHDLIKALVNPEISAVWCLRGGWGSQRLLPALAAVSRPQRSKYFIGLSDITSLHVFLNQNWGWPTLHGPVLERMGKGVPPASEKLILKILKGETTQWSCKSLKPLNRQAESQQLTGKIVGGNLTVLQTGIGTDWQVKPDGKFLFIEDVHERGYRIDRMLTQFDQAGLLKKCEGILLGDFTLSEEPGNKPSLLPKVWKAWASQLKIPIWSGVPSGHGNQQWTLGLNMNCTINSTGKSGSLHVSI
jgi:muramoyltetrapeptide carboxypeptidase